MTTTDDDPYGEDIENQMQPMNRQKPAYIDEPSIKLEMMMEVYKKAYSSEDHDFREITNALFKESLKQETMKDPIHSYGWIGKFTDELSDFCLSDWTKKSPNLLF